MNNKINHLVEKPKSKSQNSDSVEVPESKASLFIKTIEPLAACGIEVLVLQHPQEKREDLATVAILKKRLPDTIVKVGLSWPSLKKILDREVDPNRWAVIYLGTQAESAKMLESKTPISMSGKAKKLSELEGIVVLDGSWREAKTLWWRNAWLLKLNRIVLNPLKPAIYNVLRKEPRRESVSTLEAVALVLAEIKKEAEIYDQLVTPLNDFIEKVGVNLKARHKGPRKDWRRRRGSNRSRTSKK